MINTHTKTITATYNFGSRNVSISLILTRAYKGTHTAVVSHIAFHSNSDKIHNKRQPYKEAVISENNNENKSTA